MEGEIHGRQEDRDSRRGGSHRTESLEGVGVVQGVEAVLVAPPAGDRAGDQAGDHAGGHAGGHADGRAADHAGDGGPM